MNLPAAFRDHGYDVTQPSAIASHYVRSWFLADLVSSVPIDRIALAVATEDSSIHSSLMAVHSGRVTPISVADLLSLLRVLRTGRLIRKSSSLNGANFLRVCYLMYLFVLFGKWLRDPQSSFTIHLPSSFVTSTSSATRSLARAGLVHARNPPDRRQRELRQRSGMAVDTRRRRWAILCCVALHLLAVLGAHSDDQSQGSTSPRDAAVLSAQSAGYVRS